MEPSLKKHINLQVHDNIIDEKHSIYVPLRFAVIRLCAK